MKVCSKCHEPKPLSEFYIRKTGIGFGKPKPECKACNIAAAVIWNRTTRMMRVYE